MKEVGAPRPPDELILQHLGTAAMLCWAELPFKAQNQILNQANDMLGFAPVDRVRDKIVGLLIRHRKV